MFKSVQYQLGFDLKIEEIRANAHLWNEELIEECLLGYVKHGDNTDIVDYLISLFKKPLDFQRPVWFACQTDNYLIAEHLLNLIKNKHNACDVELTTTETLTELFHENFVKNNIRFTKAVERFIDKLDIHALVINNNDEFKGDELEWFNIIRQSMTEFASVETISKVFQNYHDKCIYYTIKLLEPEEHCEMIKWLANKVSRFPVNCIKNLIQIYNTEYMKTLTFKYDKDFDNEQFYKVCHYGDIDVIKYFYEKFNIAKRMDRFDNYYNPIKVVCENDDMEKLELLMSLGFNSKENINLGMQGAGIAGSMRIFQYLINHGGDNYYYALSASAFNDHVEFIKELLEYNKDKYDNVDIEYALKQSAENNALDAFKYLLNYHHQNHQNSEIDFDKIFISACRDENIDIVKYIYQLHFNKKINLQKIDEGFIWACVERRDNNIMFLYHRVSSNGILEGVKHLCKNNYQIMLNYIKLNGAGVFDTNTECICCRTKISEH